MSKYVEHKKYYKLNFSVDIETAEDVTWVREAMEGLEQEPLIMRCFQNVNVTHNNNNNPKVSLNNWSSDCNAFSIYYREENNKSIHKFLFKVKLRFPNFKHECLQTMKEYS